MGHMTAPTFIAIIDFNTSAAERPTVIAQLEHERPTVEGMPGCIGFRVFPSAKNDTEITLLHEWADLATFTDYLASDVFAQAGEMLRPLMAGPPTSRRFQAELIETTD